MKKSGPILITMFLAAACASPVQQAPADDLLTQLNSTVKAGTILFGQQDALMYGHYWKAEEGSDLDRSDVKEVCGKHPAVLGLDLGGIEMADSANLDGNLFTMMRQAAIAQHERGGIVTLSWHPRNPLTGGDSWDVSSKEVVASVLEGGANHELFMGWLSRAADFMESLRDADGSLIPLIFRPWHEHTGSWFWWGQELCSKEEYLALWELTYNYFDGERKLSNLVWAYSPGAGPDAEGYMERYPSDEKVDILGIDCYQYGESEVFAAQLSNTLAYMSVLAREHGKLIAVTEAGYEGIPEHDWWTGTLMPAIEAYPVAYVLVWRNAHDNPGHFYAPYLGAVSEADFIHFSEDSRIKLL